LDRPGSFLLNDGCSLAGAATDLNVFNLQADQVAGPELAVDGEIEQG
jgi:hypothetical protein